MQLYKLAELERLGVLNFHFVFYIILNHSHLYTIGVWKCGVLALYSSVTYYTEWSVKNLPTFAQKKAFVFSLYVKAGSFE